MAMAQTQAAAEAFIALGSNLNNPSAQLDEAVELWRQYKSCQIIKVSSYLRNPAVGPVEQPDFVNAVMSINTTLSPHALLDICLSIEQRMGRVRSERWGPRTIDCDIILYGQQVVNDDTLIIPHPQLQFRTFVYEPLLEICPTAKWPDGTPIQELVMPHAL